MIRIQVLDSSYCRALKNEKHWNILWDLLSHTYKAKVQVGPYFKLSTLTRSYFSKQGGKFGTGLLPYVIEYLEKEELEYNIEWLQKPEIPERIKEVSVKGITFEKYQNKIFNVLQTQNRGVIKSPTGSGKTLITVGMIKLFKEVPTLILVPRRNIAEKTHKELTTYGIDAGIIQGGNQISNEKIQVAVWNSVLSLIDNNFKFNERLRGGMVIVDECQMAKSAINKILKAMPDVWLRFGLSATPVPRAKKAEWFKVTEQLGPIITQITDTQAESRVTDVEMVLFTNYKESKCKTYQDMYVKDFILCPKRNKLIANMVRYALIDKQKENILILVDEIRHANAIASAIEDVKELSKLKTIIAHSKIKAELLRSYIDKMNKFKIPILIATGVFGVGTDIPNVDSILIASARENLDNLLQKIGRGRRKTEDKSLLFAMDIFDDFGDRDKWFFKYSIRRKSLYKKRGWLEKIIEEE